MTKLTEKERQALDNACARLRETKLGTKIGKLEDFVDINTLKTDAETVSTAINELFDKWANPLLNITIPPPGFFTLAGDAEGNLWCFCNDETNPPVFEHNDDTGDLYLYIASEDGENGYKVHVGNYIAVKHLNDYYTKTETDNKLSGKSNTGHNHDERYYTESEVNTKLGGKSDTGHTHDDRYFTESEINTKLSGKSDTNHTHDTRYYLKSEVDGIEDALQSAINSLVGFTAEVVSSLPATGENGVMYLVLSESGANQDIYDEYIYVNNSFEKIGNTSVSVDLSGYATVDFVNSALSAKADTGHDHGVNDIYYSGSSGGKYGIDIPLGTVLSTMNNDIDGKADTDHNHDDRYYTEGEVDSKLSGKANTGHSHDDRYYTEGEVDSKLSGKANTGHSHDDRYYTESEVDSKLGGKANSSHSHSRLYAVDIPAYSDLNDYTTDGIYATDTWNTTKTLYNIPVQYSFLLEVNTVEDGLISQVFHAYGTNYLRLFERLYRPNKGWGEWVEYTNTSITPYTASDLTTNFHTTRVGQTAIISWWRRTITVSTTDTWTTLYTLPFTNHGRTVYTSNICDQTGRTLYFRVPADTNTLQYWSSNTGSMSVHAGQLVLFASTNLGGGGE